MVAFAEVLQAAGPDPDLAGPLALFGRFAGAWDIEWRGADQGGKPAVLPVDRGSLRTWRLDEEMLIRRRPA
jgi:hypothetical protein